MEVVPCLLCYMSRLGVIAAYVHTGESLYTFGKVCHTRLCAKGLRPFGTSAVRVRTCVAKRLSSRI
jgi:hypothetical protein